MESAQRSTPACLTSILRYWVVALACALLTPSSVMAELQDHAATYTVESMPVWVVAAPAYETTNQAGEDDGDGYQWHLLEKHFNAVDRNKIARFVAIEYSVLTPEAVTSNSQLSVDFDPAYEHVAIHELSIQRGAKIIDKLSDTQGRVLQREEDLESLYYNGSKTVSFLLDDVRPGDSIRWSYTITGNNPVFEGEHEASARLNGWFAIDRIRIKARAPSDTPLQIRYKGQGLPIQERDKDGITQYSLELHDVPSYSESDETPAWMSGYQTLVFSSINSWQDVSAIDRKHYIYTKGDNPDITELASTITANHASDKARIGAALQWAQSEIRYYAVLAGEASHKPATVEHTLSNRYGDCKAKTRLLIALLEELGFESDAALVDTTMTLLDPQQPYRLHAFDHVITHLEYNDNHYWLDATRDPQVGDLGEFSESDFGMALVLANEEARLLSMHNARSVFKEQIVNRLDLSDAPGSPATLDITNTRVLAAAEYRRSWSTQATPVEFTATREDDLRQYFPGLQAARLSSIDSNAANRVITREAYTIDGIWSTHLIDGTRREFRADRIWSSVYAPTDAWFRDTAFDQGGALEVSERWEIRLAGKPEFDPDTIIIESPYLEFIRSMQWIEEEQLYVVDYHLKRLKRTVSAGDMRQYAGTVAKVESLSEFSLTVPPPRRNTASLTGLFRAWVGAR